MNVFAVGASKGVGYHSAIRLLHAGYSVTFMLESTSVFDTNFVIQHYISFGQVKLVKGDAMFEDDVRNAWIVASEEGPVDLALFTIGGKSKFVFGRGFVVSPPNTCTRSMINLLKTMPPKLHSHIKLIVLSTAGACKLGRRCLPFFLRIFYRIFYSQPHEVKLGLDRVVFHASGKTWPANETPIKFDVLPQGWKKELPASGFLQNVLVVKPVLFIGGGCKADQYEKLSRWNVRDKGYRVTTIGISLPGSYTISRADVAHFIVHDGVLNWEMWGGKVAIIGY